MADDNRTLDSLDTVPKGDDVEAWSAQIGVTAAELRKAVNTPGPWSKIVRAYWAGKPSPQ